VERRTVRCEQPDTEAVNWSWPGAVAMVLAVAVSVGLIEAIYFVARGEINTPGSNALAVITGAIVGAISTYLGTRTKNGD
jgi:hypothetical protein